MKIAQLISQQKDYLSHQLESYFRRFAEQCGTCIDDKKALDALLHSYLDENIYVDLAYVSGRDGTHIGINFSHSTVSDFLEPYLLQQALFKRVNCAHPFYLSDAYIPSSELKPYVNAVHGICRGDQMIGVLVLAIDLEKIPMPKQKVGLVDWRQIKGDPAIRSNLFNQQRVSSPMDKEIKTVNRIARELVCELGVFHIKLYYPASRATLWTYENPYNYRVHVLDEIISPNICLLYPKKPYPKEATVSKEQVAQVLEYFSYLRFMDENLYLKAANLNIINGMIGLRFSCDGSHFLPVEVFLQKFEGVYAS